LPAQLFFVFADRTSACGNSHAASGDNSGLPTVVIDAGHGVMIAAEFPGQRIAEKDMNLDVAQRLRKCSGR